MSMDLNLVVQHPLYKHLLRFAAKTDAREKLLRLLQYFVRFMRCWRFRRTIAPEWERLLPGLQASFTLARKPLRALKPLNHLDALCASVCDELTDPVLRYAEALKQLGFLLFFSLDAVQWLKMLGLVGGKNSSPELVRNVGHYASGMWCLALVGGLAKDLRQLQILVSRRRAASASSSTTTTTTTTAKVGFTADKVRRDLTKNVLDMVIALNLYRGWGLDDGFVGGCGVVTSVLGLQDLWNASL